MASIISSGTTSGTALNMSGDTSGVLQLATNGTTTALTLDASQRAAFVAGTAALPAITTTGDTNTGIWFPAADTIAFTEGGTESMRIDSSGNVGIGTSSPSQKLSVLGVIGASGSGGGNASNPSATHTSSSSVRVGLRGNLMTSDNAALYGVGTYLANNLFFKNATGYLGYIESAPACYIGLVDDVISFLRIGTGTANADIPSFSESMRIDSSGNLLVNGTTNSNNSKMSVITSGSYLNGIEVHTAGNNNAMTFYSNSSTYAGAISLSGSTTSYTSASDYRLKESITPMTGALAKVAQLKPVTYKWKTDGSDGQGFIAHELQAVVPDCVTGEKDATREQEYEVTPAVKDEQGKITTPAVMGTRTVPAYQGVDTSFLVATLTAAIQELKAINDTQAETINALTARIVAIESK